MTEGDLVGLRTHLGVISAALHPCGEHVQWRSIAVASLYPDVRNREVGMGSQSIHYPATRSVSHFSHWKTSLAVVSMFAPL